MADLAAPDSSAITTKNIYLFINDDGCRLPFPPTGIFGSSCQESGSILSAADIQILSFIGNDLLKCILPRQRQRSQHLSQKESYGASLTVVCRVRRGDNQNSLMAAMSTPARAIIVTIVLLVWPAISAFSSAISSLRSEVFATAPCSIARTCCFLNKAGFAFAVWCSMLTATRYPSHT